ncbi:MAG: tetratricopeptide repeat protein [Thermoleophilaceae bacterium]
MARLPKLGLVALVFVVALGAFALLSRAEDSSSRGAGSEGTGDTRALAGDTQGQIEDLQDQVRAAPEEASGYSALGDAYLQRARETGDAGLYLQAEGAFDQALRRDPEDLAATVGVGTLALARHDFRAGLRLGRRARALAPTTVRPFAVVVDSQIELGQYEKAERSLQQMVDRKPNLDSYSRISYFRELEGDLPGAIEAMRLAVSAGGGTPENEAYVQTLLGDLELEGANVAGATEAYRGALAKVPGHPPAQAGLAKVDIAAGRLERAQRRLRSVSDRLPLPIYVIPLAEVELALGRQERAAEDLEIVRVQRRLLEDAGTRADVDLVLFEADHGSARRAVRLGRGVLADAPSVRSEDALGWAYTRAGQPARGLALARRALRRGSVDPSFHYHAGMAARQTGDLPLARRELREALSLNPAFSPLHAQRARRALKAMA